VAAEAEAGVADASPAAQSPFERPQANGDHRPVIRVEDLSRIYEVGDMKVPALRGVTLRVEPGEFVAVRGPSGSGKSTFMNLLGCLDRPTAGRYFLAGEDVSTYDSDRLAQVRNRYIGFVFQGFNLLSRTTALENVEVPLYYSNVSSQDREARAREVLNIVGLAERMDHFPSQLSGGQQQRVAIARALVNAPELLLADEPTGNLDSRTSVEIMAIMQRLNRERGLTILLVTHEPDIAEYASRIIGFRDGHLVDDVRVDKPREAAKELAHWPADEWSAAAET
jgi:putative ABC transport system ATP-binding protein